MIEKGDILICKKKYSEDGSWSSNLKGNRYVIRNIVVNGERNVNVYVSSEEGSSTPFSLYKDYDKYLSYSSLHLGDYFVSLVEVREEKLKQLGL
jgi:hypothetical protein